VVGAHCLDEPENKENLERARGWLISGTLRGSVPAARQLAGLYARDVEGIGSSKDAVGLYEAILKDHDDAETRRYLAQMLVSGKGAEKDVARAEALLRTDAEKGDAESQSVLGAWLLDLDETDARRSEGREWLKKSAAGSTTGAVRYASALWYGRGGVVDHAKAREIWQAQIANDSTFARNDFAWAVCTPRDPALLDAKAGLAAAEARATAENAPIPIMDTYAACLAASGDHAAAATMQQRVVTAMEALPSASKEGIERMRKRLALYQRGERAVEDE
jgi:TPR repeat protein